MDSSSGDEKRSVSSDAPAAQSQTAEPKPQIPMLGIGGIALAFFILGILAIPGFPAGLSSSLRTYEGTNDNTGFTPKSEQLMNQGVSISPPIRVNPFSRQQDPLGNLTEMEKKIYWAMTWMPQAIIVPLLMTVVLYKCGYRIAQFAEHYGDSSELDRRPANINTTGRRPGRDNASDSESWTQALKRRLQPTSYRALMRLNNTLWSFMIGAYVACVLFGIFQFGTPLDANGHLVYRPFLAWFLSYSVTGVWMMLFLSRPFFDWGWAFFYDGDDTIPLHYGWTAT